MIPGRAALSRVGPILARGRWNARRALRAVRRAGPGRTVGAIDATTELSAWDTEITGWAACPDDTVVAVLVTVDGTVHLAEHGAHRIDVARAHHGAVWALSSGWRIALDLQRFDGQEITVQAHAVTGRGLVDQLADRRVRVVARPLAHLLSPRDGDEVAIGFVDVRGVALTPDRVARVDITVNGRPAGPARLLAGATPDLEVRSTPWSAVSGFHTLIDLRHCAPGSTAVVTGRMTDVRGNAMDLERARLTLSSRPVAPVNTEAVTKIQSTTDALDVAGAAVPSEIRLVMLTHDLGPGGGQLYLTELARQLRRSTPWPMLVVSQRDGALRAELEEAGIVVRTCGDFPMHEPLEYETMVAGLATTIAEFGGNVVLGNTMLAAIGTDVAARLGLPSLLAIHESLAFDEFFAAAYTPGWAHPYVVERLRRGIASAGAVIFEADATRHLYESEGDPRRFVTVPYGVAMDDIDEYVKAHDRGDLRREHGIAENARMLLCMGTYEPRKAQTMLVTSFAELAREQHDVVLYLVGERDDVYSQLVRDLVDACGLRGRVQLVPVVDDPSAWYRMADLLVSASDLESMPRSILEAMAYGLPVLSASAFGVSEIIEDGVTGWLFEPRDAAALDAGLRRALAVPAAVRQDVIDAAGLLVREQHDSSGYGLAYERLIGGLGVDRGALPGDLLHA